MKSPVPENIQAVLFDVYGTLLEITRPTRPYKRLLKLASDQGVDVRRTASALLMSRPMTLTQAAQCLGISLSKEQAMVLARDLSSELESVRIFPEVSAALTSLRQRGYRIGVCSNVASPYVAPAHKLLEPFIDAAIWSCEVGVVKPDPRIYGLAVRKMGVSADSVFMVGDSLSADVEGPRAAGLIAKLLDRRRIHSPSNGLLTLEDLV
ncbi:HAD family hydrolase [Pseudoxanthomonas wuyuanensis]